ncbi:uncharacterized protein [Arachis hypogaea]|uniref:uncharacterized protein n=1 Tax=Arachis hypogaea TaxID=3818 RepID=UPI003B211B8C
MALSFYSDLYTDSLPAVPFVLNNVFPCLSMADHNIIGGSIFVQEIKEAVFAMGSFKAPGRDDLQAFFYQNQWDRVGPDLCNLIQCIYVEPQRIHEINETLITLIPKVDPITSLK